MRLAFMGTPDFAVPTLHALRAAGHEIAMIYTQPPRMAGRGMREQRSPVHKAADALNIPVRVPARLKGAAEHEAFQALELDAAVVVAYGLILPKQILDAPKLGCLNVHGSLLPCWRGAAPIQRAVMAGDGQTGVTTMCMDEGLDTGPVLLSQKVPIGPDTTAGMLHDTLSEIGAGLMVRTLSELAAGTLKPHAQSETGVTYADKISKAEARIDWSRPARELDCRIRGLTPFPGAWFELVQNGKPVRIKVLRAVPADGTGAAGTVLDDRLTVACGDGALRVIGLQRAGKAPATAEAFLRGFTLAPGTILA